MTVYIDDMKTKHHTMVLSHMVATTREELLEMAHKLKLKKRWIQEKAKGQPPHFDVSEAKIRTAIHNYGDKRVSVSEMGRLLLSGSLEVTPKREGF